MGFDIKRKISVLQSLAKAELIAKQNRMVAGFAWQLLEPLLLAFILFLLFSAFSNTSIPHFSLYILIGIMIWHFFMSSILKSMEIFLQRKQLLRKIAIEPIDLILSSVIIEGVRLLVYYVVILCIVIITFGFELHLLYSIIPLIILFVLTCFVSLIGALFFVKIRDIKYVSQILLQGFFFMTPIFYSRFIIPEHLQAVYAWNPITSIMEMTRHYLIGSQTMSTNELLISFGIFCIIICLGIVLYAKLRKSIVEAL